MAEPDFKTGSLLAPTLIPVAPPGTAIMMIRRALPHAGIPNKTASHFGREESATANRCEALRKASRHCQGLRMNLCLCPREGRVGQRRDLLLPRHLARSFFRLERGQPRVACKSPWRFLQRAWKPERGPLSPPGLSNSQLPPLPFWNFFAASLPTCFQFAVVASSDCDLNQRERVRGEERGRGKAEEEESCGSDERSWREN